ncbi:MAG TPA: carboxymuconolactone decarboxylase family protein [Steroidobacteraceae bacterium]
MKNPLVVLPDALKALLAVNKAATDDGLPDTTCKLIHLRASQINGCSVCVDMHARELKQSGEKDERIFAVAAWRETPYFTDSEGAALALTEATTRLSDRGDAVPDLVWNEAARHYGERALAALVLQIAVINAFNRINAATRQIAGAGMETRGNGQRARAADTERAAAERTAHR